MSCRLALGALAVLLLALALSRSIKSEEGRRTAANLAYVEKILGYLNNADECVLPTFDEVDELDKALAELQADLGDSFEDKLSDDMKLAQTSLLKGWAEFRETYDSPVVLKSAKKRSFLCKVESYQEKKFGRSVCAGLQNVRGPITERIFRKNPIVRYLEHLESGEVVDPPSEAEVRAEAEARAARAEQEERERAEAEALAKAEAEAEAEERARVEAEERAKAEAEEKARAEAEEKARAEAEERARALAEAEERARAEAEERAKAVAEAEERARALAEAEERARAEAEENERQRAEAEAKLAEARARAEAEHLARAEAGERAKALVEAEERAKALAEAVEKARAEAQAEKRARAEAEAELAEERSKAEAAERERAAVEARAKEEAEQRARLEAEEKVRAKEAARAEVAARALADLVAREVEEAARAKEAAAWAEKMAMLRAAIEERARVEAEEQARADAERSAELEKESTDADDLDLADEATQMGDVVHRYIGHFTIELDRAPKKITVTVEHESDDEESDVERDPLAEIPVPSFDQDDLASDTEESLDANGARFLDAESDDADLDRLVRVPELEWHYDTIYGYFKWPDECNRASSRGDRDACGEKVKWDEDMLSSDGTWSKFLEDPEAYDKQQQSTNSFGGMTPAQLRREKEKFKSDLIDASRRARLFGHDTSHMPPPIEWPAGVSKDRWRHLADNNYCKMTFNTGRMVHTTKSGYRVVKTYTKATLVNSRRLLLCKKK